MSELFILDQMELEKEVSSSLQKDLKIIHRKKTYSVISFIAAGKSRYIYNLFLSDPLIVSIELNLPKGDLTPIINFLNGEPFSNPSNSIIFLYEAAIELEIEELIITLQKQNTVNFDYSTAIRLFKLSFVHGFDCPLIVNYIQENINENFANELFAQLSEAQLDFLLKKANFSLNQRMLILNNFDFTKKPNNRLCKYIKDPSVLLSNPNLNLNTLRYVLLERFFNIHENEE